MKVYSHNPAHAYVEGCISAMRFALSREDLVEWWIDEQPHRRKWGLSEHYPPGSELNEAFRTKLTELKQEIPQ